MAAALGLTATPAMADSPGPWQILFQDTATSTAQVGSERMGWGAGRTAGGNEQHLPCVHGYSTCRIEQRGRARAEMAIISLVGALRQAIAGGTGGSAPGQDLGTVAHSIQRLRPSKLVRRGRGGRVGARTAVALRLWYRLGAGRSPRRRCASMPREGAGEGECWLAVTGTDGGSSQGMLPPGFGQSIAIVTPQAHMSCVSSYSVVSWSQSAMLMLAPACPARQAMVDLHHDITFFVITVVVLVFYMMFQVRVTGVATQL